MSDVQPQCWECKFNPCKWYSEKERLEINSSFEKCPHFQENELGEILNNIEQ